MILNRQRTVRVARPPLEAFLARVREQLRLNGAEITVALVSDPAIARMNELYRHKKGPTDVLSFPADHLDASFKYDVTSKQDFVGAQHCLALRHEGCAPSPHDRSVKARRHRAKFTVPNRLRATREGTTLVVPNSAKEKGALAPEAHHLGDIAISPATARRNAKKFRRTLPNELQILILHGVLHLLGYDHEADNGQMTRIENRLRRKLGLQ